jgi:hypothetical protein
VDDVSELLQGAPSGFLVGHPVRAQIRCPHLEVKLQLLLHILAHIAAGTGSE